MKLYLVRHGEAKSRDEDPEQGLNENGHAAVLKVAAFAQSAGVCPARILHSGKTRARQTAKIMAGLLKPAPEIAKSDGLDPMDDPGIWIKRLAEEAKPRMLVGHLPYMGRLASVLLCGSSEMETVTFATGSLLCLNRSSEGAWTVQWMVMPALLR